jgi:hypothetical protein
MSAVHKHAAAQVITASGNSTAQQVPTVIGNTLGVVVRATAVSGTSPSLTAKVQWSDDGTNFVDANPVDALSAVTAVGGTAAAFTIKAPYYRVAWTVTGTTPSFTVTASAHFA